MTLEHFRRTLSLPSVLLGLEETLEQLSAILGGDLLAAFYAFGGVDALSLFLKINCSVSIDKQSREEYKKIVINSCGKKFQS